MMGYIVFFVFLETKLARLSWQKPAMASFRLPDFPPKNQSIEVSDVSISPPEPLLPGFRSRPGPNLPPLTTGSFDHGIEKGEMDWYKHHLPSGYD
jgi:hypothetical protein